jgi:hypothetical protein
MKKNKFSLLGKHVVLNARCNNRRELEEPPNGRLDVIKVAIGLKVLAREPQICRTNILEPLIMIF